MEMEEKLIQQRVDKLNSIKKLNVNPYPYTFKQTHHAEEILTKYEKLKKEEHTKDKVSIAGRIMTLRPMGKAAFGHLQDESGKIQFYIREDEVGKENYELFKLLDLGDIIGLQGTIFRTKMGEISIKVNKLDLLTKSLHPLPEKWHGLKDTEIRYRKRYLDLIANQDVIEVFKKRALVVDEIRSFLKEKGFLEAEIPTLQPVYGGAAAKPFKTHLNAFNVGVYLQISPELYLKRLIIGGIEKVFFMGKNFRNEDVDRTHNPEFTMVEWYEAYIDYNQLMKDAEELISKICKKINKTTKIKYNDKEIDFKPPFQKLTMIEAIKKYAKLDINKMSDEELKSKVKELDKEIGSRDVMINEIFEALVEDKLIQPTFILDYPLTISPLTKVHRENPKLVERFELFINGTEIANAYSELNDPIDQESRFDQQEKARKEGQEEVYETDKEFVTAMMYGMPPCGGIGIGVDRLVMLMTNQQSIRDVIPFPFMKPENDD